MNAKQTPHFIFYLSADWETYHRPDMIRAFARRIGAGGGRLLCVDRLMCSLTGALRGRGMGMRIGGPSRGFGKWVRCMTRYLTRRDAFEKLDDNLYLMNGVVALDDRFALRYPSTQALNRRLLKRQIAKTLDRLGFDDRPLVTWFQHPYWEHYAGMLHERAGVYECFDQYAADPGISADRVRWVSEAEKKLFEKMDLVITTSNRLLDEKKAFHDRIHCVHNGADVRFYSRVRDDSTLLDPACASFSHPVVGYLGTLNEHTDLGLIHAIACKRPDWTIVMVGKIDHRKITESEDFQKLQEMKNVHVMGWIDRDRLLPVCKSFDVCIIPYRRDSGFNPYVNPNKLHEYTAMGKPIVALRGVEVETHRDLIWIADTPEQFIGAIEEAFATDSEEKIAERLRVAWENSWDARVSTMLERVEEVMTKDPT